MDNLGRLQKPIKMTVEDGRGTKFEGGRDADRLEKIVNEAGEGARNIAEAPSLGTNPDLQLIGDQPVDKKVLGTAHIAIGDNRSLGGSVQSDIHLDGVISHPTVTFDGETVVDDGTFQRDKVLKLAEEYP
jgi:leucyl aminopeptidase (aminopeptidase T)